MRLSFAFFLLAALPAFTQGVPGAGSPPTRLAAPSGGTTTTGISFVSAVAAGADTNISMATTAAIDTTQANFLVAVVTAYLGGGGACTIFDSNSNTWTTLNTQSNSGDPQTMLYSVTGPVVGPGHTFSAMPTPFTAPAYCAISVMAFGGVAASSPLDGAVVGAAGSGATVSIGALTPSLAGDLIVSAIGGHAIDSAAAINSGFTIPANVTVAESGGNHYGSSMAYLIQSASASVTPVWTLGSGSSGLGGFNAAFK